MSKLKITQGSGNIFSDLNLDNAEELKLRSDYACKILQFQKRHNLTATQLADAIQASEQETIQLINGEMKSLTTEKLELFYKKIVNS